MEERKWGESVIKLVKQRNIFLVLLLGLMAANIIQGMLLFGKKERVIIVPAYFKQGFWSEGEVVSDTYVEEMAVFMSKMILDTTPESHKYRREMILRYVMPEYYHKMEKKLIEEGDRMARDGVTTTFAAKEIAASSDELKAVISWTVTTYVSVERICQTKVKYEMELGYSSGIIMLKNFKIKEES